MYRRYIAVGLSLLGLLSLAPGQASASALGAPPLQLGLGLDSSFSPPPVRARPQRELRADLSRMGIAAGRRQTAPAAEDRSLRQRALQSVLNAPELNLDESAVGAGQETDPFKFQRRGSALRSFSRSYKDVCSKVSSKIWDDPNGRRIRFDIAGKPGVAIEIPMR